MKGIGVSPGISIGRAYVMRKSFVSVKNIKLTSDAEKIFESEKFENSVRVSVEEIESMKKNRQLFLNSDEIDILNTQIEFLTDPQIKTDVLDKIHLENRTSYDAVNEVITYASEMFRNMDDEYFKARAADIDDIGNRLLKNLNIRKALPETFPDDTILIADDLAPSDTISLDTSRIVGFATLYGGKTSHTVIIAKSKGIPAVVACGNELLSIKTEDVLILDGGTGDVILNPDPKTLEEYKIKQAKIAEELSTLKSIKNLPSQTTDGHKITLSGNISNENDLIDVFSNGGEGVGLFRTELFFLERTSFPSEEEQFQFYKQVAIKSKNTPIVIRTLDIGGDKQLPYFEIPPENNPFLGYRAIRICLDRKDIFLTQLKAILRASAFGNLKIMFPMISNIDEVLEAKLCVEDAKNELLVSGISFNEKIEIGIMIEIPSSALMIDILSKEVDFFSIGTNDLCQYTLAVDRMNCKVSGLYNYFNPGFLRLMKNIIEQAHKYSRHVAICGEMASDPLATMLLTAMGVDELSMGAASIPAVKNIIINNSFPEATRILDTVMGMNNTESIIKYLKKIK